MVEGAKSLQLYGIAGTFFPKPVAPLCEFSGHFRSDRPLGRGEPVSQGSVELRLGDRFIRGNLTDHFWGSSIIEGRMNDQQLEFSKYHYTRRQVETSGAWEEADVLSHWFDFKFRKHDGIWIGEYDFHADGKVQWTEKANCATFLVPEPFKVLLELPDYAAGMDIMGNKEVIVPVAGDLTLFSEGTEFGTAQKGTLAGLPEVHFDSKRGSYEMKHEVHLLWIRQRSEWVAVSFSRHQETVAEQMVSWTGPYVPSETCLRKILEAYKIPSDKLSARETLHTGPSGLERIVLSPGMTY